MTGPNSARWEWFWRIVLAVGVLVLVAYAIGWLG